MPQLHSSNSVREPQTVSRGKRLYRGVFAIGILVYFVLNLYPTILAFSNLAIPGVVAQATMTGLERSGVGRATSYHPIYEFSLGNGGLATVKSYLSISRSDYSNGKRIKIVYLPADPHMVAPRIRLLFWQFIGFWLAGSGILACMIFGFSELKKAAYPPRRGVAGSDKLRV